MPDSALKLPIHYACEKSKDYASRSDSPKNNSYLPNQIKHRQEREDQIHYEILESLLDDKPESQNIDLAQTDSKGYNAWHYRVIHEMCVAHNS